MIGNIQQSASPNFRNSDELNAVVDINFSNDPIVPSFRTQVFGDKISDISSRYIYMRCRLNLVAESVNPVAPQFMNNRLSVVISLNKSTGVWRPATRIRRSPDVTHCSAVDHVLGKGSAFGDDVVKNYYIVKKTIKLILKFGWKFQTSIRARKY